MESTVQLIESPLRAPFVVPALILLLIFLCWWRAGSAYVLLEWLWRRFRIRATVQDPRLKRFIHENAQIVRLRFVYGIKVDSFTAMQRLLGWANDHSVSAADVKRCRKWTVIQEGVSVTPPSKPYAVGLFGAVVVAGLLLYASIGFGMISTRYALLKTKESGVLFLTDGVVVRRVGDEPVAAADCKKDISGFAKAMGFEQREAIVTCNALGGTELRSFTALVRHEQELASLLVGILFLFLSWYSYSEWSAAVTAMKLSARLMEGKGLTSAQPVTGA